MTRIKICGITNLEDALEAARLGVDALGFVFYDKSPRNVEIATAAAITREIPPFVCRVGLFVDSPEEHVRKVLEAVELDLLQFHGGELEHECTRYGKSYLKAVPMGGGIDPVVFMRSFSSASGFLLDSHAVGTVGGSGETFDWSNVPASERPLILAGGLSVDNVADAVMQVRPYGVDVSSGVERAKGLKDSVKMKAFIEKVREADVKTGSN